MKLLKRFRKQGPAEDMEAQASRELEAAAAARPAEAASPVPAMAPIPGEVGDPAVGDGTNGDAPGPVPDLPVRRRSAPNGDKVDKVDASRSSTAKTSRTRSAGAGATAARAASPRVKTAKTKTAATATPAASTRAPVRKSTKKAGAGAPVDAEPLGKSRATGANGAAKKPRRAGVSQPAATRTSGRATATPPAPKKR